MARYVALLRGIGPSDPNMRNAKLREVCERLGLRNVTTVISSGNLIFDADTSDRSELEATLEAAWPEHLGFHSTSILRTVEELAALRDLAPFGDRTHGADTYLLVTFAQEPITWPFPIPHQPCGPASTVVAATDREVFTDTDTTVTPTPPIMVWMERQFGTAITSRTWLTVQRILARCAAPE